ncbi:hypothetical protein AKG34_07205 [Peribacillus butanolivorans]|uniref:hypothetical protein n=1 Tax=Peribacillus butanolivorans TaxID=421767 RepID=UPI0006A6DBA4|nr:hypothetical protein [Peribacillus butanolivorans]KON68621.1 hypothetical protein AKG34_07205 [Peribacillus butanolivorans]
MSEKKELTKEELQQRVKCLEYDLNKWIKIENKLIEKIARKEHENTIISVKIEEISEGFVALQKQQEITEDTKA